MTDSDREERRRRSPLLPIMVVLLRILQVAIGLIASYYYILQPGNWVSQRGLLGAAASILLLFASIALTSRTQRRINRY